MGVLMGGGVRAGLTFLFSSCRAGIFWYNMEPKRKKVGRVGRNARWNWHIIMGPNTMSLTLLIPNLIKKGMGLILLGTREAWLLTRGDWNNKDRLFGSTQEANDRRIDIWMNSGTQNCNNLHNSARTIVEIKTNFGKKDIDSRLDVANDLITQWLGSSCPSFVCSTSPFSARMCEMTGMKDDNNTSRWQKLSGHDFVKY
ncbi:hypothetical protein L1987_07747 [Smallanthus sonchifolius]|uniref:Uncharacterized protein n=1 Tax=Smallanthus sonchifolius TaxID=185202 RepID=A0ACB9JJ43_9ASTR|nr:hypothetical protein L1987_07747 [Smallanthus sonchifolius]